MRKQNVFLVSGRFCGKDGYPSGDVVNYVVCAEREGKVRGIVGKAAPDFSVLSVTSLVTLEESVKKVKACLAGTDKRWQVLVDPHLRIS
ncbi:MAG TPA: hypothetical protein VJ654_12785 [Noviherbaspirillum sp.]|nr:hypothetical protein [Noviherbaspirillum sp.]